MVYALYMQQKDSSNKPVWHQKKNKRVNSLRATETADPYIKLQLKAVKEQVSQDIL